MKEYGSMTDDGGKTYKTVVIGEQTWMAANLNYNPNPGQNPNTITGHKCYYQGYRESESDSRDDLLLPEQAQANCDKYGRLYNWATAMDLPASCNNASCASQIQKPHKGICPNGWHIPDTTEWKTLRVFIEDEIFENWEDEDFGWDVGTKLKAIAGWKEASTTDYGVDSYGFGAIGSGYCVSCESDKLTSAAGFYAGEKEEAHWWSATEYINKNLPGDPVIQAYKSKITYNKKVMNQEKEKKGDFLYSVRCMKN
jgi:uncharacterized protein (TIGR02145 family)